MTIVRRFVPALLAALLLAACAPRHELSATPSPAPAAATMSGVARGEATPTPSPTPEPTLSPAMAAAHNNATNTDRRARFQAANVIERRIERVGRLSTH